MLGSRREQKTTENHNVTRGNISDVQQKLYLDGYSTVRWVGNLVYPIRCQIRVLTGEEAMRCGLAVKGCPDSPFETLYS